MTQYNLSLSPAYSWLYMLENSIPGDPRRCGIYHPPKEYPSPDPNASQPARFMAKRLSHITLLLVIYPHGQFLVVHKKVTVLLGFFLKDYIVSTHPRWVIYYIFPVFVYIIYHQAHRLDVLHLDVRDDCLWRLRALEDQSDTSQ